ncbi:hypothetical protein ACQ4WX_48540 [Streptomyces lasalocidi]
MSPERRQNTRQSLPWNDGFGKSCGSGHHTICTRSVPSGKAISGTSAAYSCATDTIGTRSPALA